MNWQGSRLDLEVQVLVSVNLVEAKSLELGRILDPEEAKLVVDLFEVLTSQFECFRILGLSLAQLARDILGSILGIFVGLELALMSGHEFIEMGLELGLVGQIEKSELVA